MIVSQPEASNDMLVPVEAALSAKASCSSDVLVWTYRSRGAECLHTRNEAASDS